ncbi:MAG: hypothetical protein M3O55_04630 [Actinomycetota bacterium]|nr:hypothetical protein [Actinomycetota bacterium]
MRKTRFLGLLIAVAALMPFLSAVTPAAAATALNLPGGRANYVVVAIGGPANQMYVRLATYQFATNNTMTEKVWSWRQNSISGTAANMKRYSGYTTSGCLRVCAVRTPINFQPGGTPITATGTWRMDAYGHLSIGWSWGAGETWRLDSRQAGFTSMSIWSSNQAIVKGWGFGSNAAATSGATIGQAFAATRLYGPLVQNVYGANTQYLNLGFNFPDYNRCSNSTCLQGKAVVAADKRTWFNTYIAGNPQADGRKNFWNFQTGGVAQMEQPGTSCISTNGGGHTAAMLQVIDDSGRFRGWVGVEASLVQMYWGRAIVSAFATVQPTMLTTLH